MYSRVYIRVLSGQASVGTEQSAILGLRITTLKISACQYFSMVDLKSPSSLFCSWRCDVMTLQVMRHGTTAEMISLAFQRHKPSISCRDDSTLQDFSRVRGSGSNTFWIVVYFCRLSREGDTKPLSASELWKWEGAFTMSGKNEWPPKISSECFVNVIVSMYIWLGMVELFLSQEN